jgi:hypothetical protein
MMFFSDLSLHVYMFAKFHVVIRFRQVGLPMDCQAHAPGSILDVVVDASAVGNSPPLICIA